MKMFILFQFEPLFYSSYRSKYNCCKTKTQIRQNKLPHKTIILFFGHLKDAYKMQLEEKRKVKPMLSSFAIKNQLYLK